MKYLIQKSLFSLAVAALIVGCGTEISGDLDDENDVTPGTADFSRFVAVGDSLTAGYADGALYLHGQENSYPAILAQQFVAAGGGAFNQPYMDPGATGSLIAGGFPLTPPVGDRLVLVPTGDPESPAAPAPISPVISTEIGGGPLTTGPFNNMGVPGARSFELGVVGYSTLNPFFARMAGPGSTVIGDAAAQLPTFFILWIGNNDVLSYATDGGANGIDQTGNPNPATYGVDDITDPGFFASPMGYPGLVDDLTAGGAKGVLINVPDVSSIPYFTTIPFNAIPFTADDATMANAGFALYNIGVQSRVGMTPGPAPGGQCGLSQAEADRRQISFAEGQNSIVILDENLADLTTCLGPAAIQMRQATPSDLILLPTLAKLGEPATIGPPGIWGVSRPLEDADVLIDTEVTAVNNARMAYNMTIKAEADADPNLILFDASAKLTELNTTGILYGSGGISSTFAQGGGFSLDGVHPTARGYAVVANEIIKVIEEGFGANLLPVDPNQYTTVFYQ